MPIIPEIGRKSVRLRSLVIAIYTLLILGAITTVYPFLLMLSTSVTSQSDFDRYVLIPRYLYSDKALTAKYLSEKYRAGQLPVAKYRYQVREPYQVTTGGQTLSRIYGNFSDFERLVEDYDLSSPTFNARVADWTEFKRAAPARYRDAYFQTVGFPLGDSQTAFQKFLKAKYGTARNAEESLHLQAGAFLLIFPPFEAYDRHAWRPAGDQLSRDWAEYRAAAPPRLTNVITARPLYERFLYDTYGRIAQLNLAWGTAYEYFWQVPLPAARPEGRAGEDWERYVRRLIPMRYVRLDVERCRPSYLEYLNETYGTVEKYNGKTGDAAPSLAAARLSEYMPEKALALYNWQAYYETKAPVEAIILDTADARYAEFLSGRYATVEALNAAHGTAHASFADAGPPWREEDYADLMANKGAIRWNYVTRNYAYAANAMFLQGRALMNTFILVVLIVVSQVTINPLAAYALSRYRLSYGSKILIFLLATMAFPAEVTMIPNFLMIRDLGLLNTFWALVLPGLASGYYIFLLKGFFDSLPPELYEAASIDGASELRMFWTITLPLSMPVLAVIALFSFGAAYGSFMWAFTTCQDPKMWTLMVYLHQLQISARGMPFVVMAALVIAAVPTVVVFLSAQKILMKGIVVPTMK